MKTVPSSNEPKSTLDPVHDWLLTILEATTDLVDVTDLSYKRLLYLNKAARDRLGIGANEDLTNLSIDGFQPAWARDLIQREAIPAVLQSGVWTGETSFRSRDGHEIAVSQLILAHKTADGAVAHLCTIARDMTDAKRAQEAVRRSEQLFRVMTENATELIALVDTKGNRLYNSPSYQTVLGYSPNELQGTWSMEQTHPDDRAKLIEAAAETKSTGVGKFIEYRMRHKDGSWRTLESHAGVIRNARGEIENILIVARDVTERKRAEKEREMMEVQLRHAQKMESIGRLAAGIAHEINTPIQYIGDNARFTKDAFDGLSRLLALQQRLLDAARTQALTSGPLAELEAAVQQADLDYLLAEIPKAIEQSLEGVERVARIVGAMKEFSHPGTEEKIAIDLNKAIESTLTVTRNEWKYVADAVTQFDPNLPMVQCLAAELNQVILNIIVNAAHAIADAAAHGKKGKGTITLSTRNCGPEVEIRIADTGTGIPEKVRDRIFEPFFTTKQMGKGTGQGLAIAHSVVVDKHGGTIHFETEVGQGTTFILRLPVNSASPTKNELS
ncbi:MAG: PAS domain S-box protein [Verrucomicrobia bacterium]|nr:PAS domain S-box protein [Verrucomicrobiota bacterium]